MLDSATIRPESFGTLKEIATVLKENADVRVKIIGHTDADGDDKSNMELSRRRAAAVKDFLAKTPANDTAVEAEEASNSVLVSVQATYFDDVRRLIQSLDQPAENPARQAEARLAELDLAEAKLALDRADKEWARIAELPKNNAISQAQVDQKQMELEHAKIQVQRALAKLQAAAPAAVLPPTAEPRDARSKTEVRLLELDLADAKLAVEEAESELARAEQIEKQSPGTISEQEIRRNRFQAERAKIQVQRIMVKLEAAKEMEGESRR